MITVKTKMFVGLLIGVILSSSSLLMADGTDGWSTYDNPKGIAKVTVAPAADNTPKQTVKLEKNGSKAGFRYVFPNSTAGLKLSWKMKFSKYYNIYIMAKTSKGKTLTISYYPGNIDNPRRFGLDKDGVNSRGGQWVTITRDLKADFKASCKDDTITNVILFMVNGNGYIADLQLKGTEAVKATETTEK